MAIEANQSATDLQPRLAITMGGIFELAALRSADKQKVTSSIIRKLIKSVTNYSGGMTVKDYRVAEINVNAMDILLKNQKSKCYARKQDEIEFAFFSASFKLTKIARKILRIQEHKSDDIPFTGEISTKKKMVHLRNVRAMKSKMAAVYKKIDNYKSAQNSLPDTEAAIRENLRQFKLVTSSLKKIDEQINTALKKIESSSYQHKREKLETLNELNLMTRYLRDKIHRKITTE